jgi:Recombination endonuclease VII
MGRRSEIRTCAIDDCEEAYCAKGLCRKHYNAKRKSDPEHQRREHAKHVTRTFGIEIEEYERLAREQGGVCAICERVPGKRRLCVDHDHDTGRVRALLCGACNRAIGCMADDPALLELAAQYLVAHGRLAVLAELGTPAL